MPHLWSWICYEGDAVFSDNYFDMDAGEERRITLYWNSPKGIHRKKSENPDTA